MFTQKRKKKLLVQLAYHFLWYAGFPTKLFSAPIQSLLNSDSNLQLFGQFVILCVNSLLQPCTYIIVYLMKKWKKKNLDTHTPFSILPYINSDHLVHKYKRNTRDQIYKKKSFVVLFKHNPEFFKAARSPWDWKPFQSCYLLSGIVPGYSF